MSSRHFIALFAAVVAIASTLVACGSEATQNVPSNGIAVVGDSVILKAEYEKILERAKRQQESAGQKFPAVGSTGYEELKNQIVAYLVRNAAVAHEAEDMGVEVTDAEVNSSLNDLIKQRFEGDKAKYRAELKKQRLTEQELKDSLRQQLIDREVQTQVVQIIKVEKSEIADYYKEHKTSYRQAESRKASHILVKTKAEADSIYRQLQAGAKFKTLAEKHSEDPGSKTSGGSLGVAEKGKFVPPFEKSLFALKTGTYSKPVKSTFGWHIIRADGPIKAAHAQSLEEATPTIEQTLLQEKQNKAVENWYKEADEYSKDHTKYASEFAPPKASTTVATTTTS